MMSTTKNYLHASETVLVLSGLLILGSVLVVFLTGNFAVWTIAKLLYGVGVILFLFNK